MNRCLGLLYLTDDEVFMDVLMYENVYETLYPQYLFHSF